jgi:hypothetical protein
VTLLGVLTAFAILGGLVLVAVLLVRGREGLDLSLGGLVRAYLYIGSLAGVIVFAVGLAGVLAYVLGASVGLDVIYGGPQPQPAIAPAPCPPNTTCPPIEPRPLVDDRVRRHGEDLVRGVTFLVFGAIFWGAHWAARRGTAGTHERMTSLYRAYLMLGTVIFGIATIALLPMGIYQALSFALVPTQPNTFYRQGAGEALSGGLAALPLWLGYLWLVMRGLRGGGHRWYARGLPPTQPPEPAAAGAHIGPGPGERHAGAAARPPESEM